MILYNRMDIYKEINISFAPGRFYLIQSKLSMCFPDVWSYSDLYLALTSLRNLDWNDI